MATSFLVQSGSAALPIEYSFIYPPLGAEWEMDRFIPSSRQPQHWSRNYHGSQERRRSVGRRRGSPEPQERESSSYRQGVTLRAEDLLIDSESKLGSCSSVPPANHLTAQPGDARRTVLGGSATELAQRNRPRTPVRRSSEGATIPRRKSSSSSSCAADDPTSSDPSSSSSTTSPTSSSSSSESGCNADSETCNYCRLSESSEERETSTDDGKNSPTSPPKVNGVCRRLTRAHSEDCYPPSKPIRRTSPGEYLRHKRDQMDKLRNEQLRDPQGRKQRCTFKRCDSDPRLSRRHRESEYPCRTLTYASPTRNRMKRITKEQTESDELLNKVILPVVPVIPVQLEEAEKSRRSTLAKNVADRRSKSKERRSSTGYNAEESTPFLQRRASFRCAVCDCDIPFTNCVLCNAEAKTYATGGIVAEVFVKEDDLEGLNNEEWVTDDVTITNATENKAKSRLEVKELEDFYDHPTPVDHPSLPLVLPSPDEKRSQWIAKGTIHKSLNQEEHRSGRRSSLRKYNSEPVPDTEDFYCSREQSDAATPKSQSASEVADHRGERSSSSSCRSGKGLGYHIAKDSPKRVSSELIEAVSSCHVCGKTAEDEEVKGEEKTHDKSRVLSPETVAQLEKTQRRSPVFLKPEFYIEPEIIHKANPLVDEADVDVIPSAMGAFRRLSEEEFISTLNIHDAAKKGDLHVVKLLTKKDPKQMETVDERGWTPIHLAAAHGHTEVVKYLAIEGAHLAALDPSSYTAIHLAAMNGHNSILEVLLPMGVNVDSITAEGFTALHLAVMNCHLDCIQTLLQWGASLDKRDALGRGIQEMVEEYNLQEVATLLRRFHKQLHNFKNLLDMMNREGRNTSEIPREFMDILASIAEESGTD